MRLVVVSTLVSCLAQSHLLYGAVHWYHKSEFEQHGDAYILKGGHEGMFHSRQHPQGSLVTPKQAGTGSLILLVADSHCLFSTTRLCGRTALI
jgi:hypothetical protein